MKVSRGLKDSYRKLSWYNREKLREANFKESRRIHPNSLKTYRESSFVTREQAILSVFKHYKFSLSDREVMLVLGFTDMNSVRPRITELIERRILIEDGSIKDTVTGKDVRLVRLRTPDDDLREARVNANNFEHQPALF